MAPGSALLGQRLAVVPIAQVVRPAKLNLRHQPVRELEVFLVTGHFIKPNQPDTHL
jgi:hypothetical protein